MKTRILFTLILALAVSFSLTLAQGKDDCTAKTASAKSCCMDGAKTAHATNTATKAKMVLASDKKSTAKEADHCDGMTAAQCAALQAAGKPCPPGAKMMKTSAKMVKASAKMDCCAGSKATKTASKKAAPEKSDAKGTN